MQPYKKMTPMVNSLHCYFSYLWIYERHQIWSKFRMITIAPVSTHYCVSDRVASVVYILHHKRTLTSTCDYIRNNKKFWPSRIFVLKELLLHVPDNFVICMITMMLFGWMKKMLTQRMFLRLSIQTRTNANPRTPAD